MAFAKRSDRSIEITNTVKAEHFDLGAGRGKSHGQLSQSGPVMLRMELVVHADLALCSHEHSFGVRLAVNQPAMSTPDDKTVIGKIANVP